MTLREEELEITFFRASGPGGQHRNRRETGVRIRHIPTGLTVSATERRSQAENRHVALERLEAALAALRRRRKKRIPTRASAASRERRLRLKRLRSAKKALRKGEDHTAR
jgi:protein subunit release factor B